ncbi:MAG: multiheme c-type cytochrome, partial [Myxococcota bacterium]
RGCITLVALVVVGAGPFVGCSDRASKAEAPAWTTVGQRVPFDFAVPLPTVGPLSIGEGFVGVKASDCGMCHQALYEEWRGSTHAAAMKDPQYYAELSKPGSPRWLCLSCHAPVQNQRRWLISSKTRLRDNSLYVEPIERISNPSFDPEMQREGVTCATCHVRVDDGHTYVVAAKVSQRAPHPVRADQVALRSICQRCHDPGEGRITPQFFCWFETAREAPEEASEDCVTCHMPSVNRSIVAGGPRRANRHHFWTGGGVPKAYEGYDQLLDRGYVPGLSVVARIESATVTITLTNERAGHYVTSADPERFIWVQTVVEDESGRRQVVDARRIGQTWDWGATQPEVRPARRVADDRIPPQGSKTWRFVVPQPAARVTVSAAHVRLTPSNARHMKRTPVHPELVDIWPQASEQVANIDRIYQMRTWFAKTTTVDGRNWVHTPLEKLLSASKRLQNSDLKAIESILNVP